MSGITIDGALATHATSPAGMAATENDYAGAAGSFARLTPNAAGTAITGFAGGVDGRVLTIVNLGAPNVTLAHQNAGSAAGNRILTNTGASVVVPPNGTASFLYDAATSRWRQTDSTGGGGGGGVTPSAGTFAARPAQGTNGNLYYPTDGYSGWLDDGAAWRPVIQGVACVAPPAAAGFTGHNTNALSSISDDSGALLFSDTNQSSALPDYRTWTKAIPGAETAVEALVWACPDVSGFNGTVQNYVFQGICLRESNTSKLALLMTVGVPGAYSIISCEYATSETTGRTVVSGQTDKRWGNNVVGSPQIYMRLIILGGNVEYQYSTGRSGWQTIATVATATVFTVAPDQYGVVVWGYNGNNPTSARAIVPHLAVY
jgi:hypothetical protein